MLDFNFYSISISFFTKNNNLKKGQDIKKSLNIISENRRGGRPKNDTIKYRIIKLARK